METRTALLVALIILVAGACDAQAVNLLANGGFDEAGEGPAAGWTLSTHAGGADAARQATGGTDGSAFVEIALPEKGQCDLRPTAGNVELAGDAAYLLTVSVKASDTAAGSHGAELQWFGADGFIRRDAAGATVADTWTRVAVGPINPPENATSVIVLLRCYDPGTYAFDSVGLWAVDAMPDNALRNAGFESDSNGDGVPDAWESVDGARGDAEGAKTGQLRARADQSASWRQGDVAVTASAKYELTAATCADEFGRDFRMAVEWLGADGDVISVQDMTDQTWTGWQAKTLRATAPAGATTATVVLENAGEGTVWFDDVALAGSGLVAEISLRLDEPNARGLLRDGIDDRVVVAWCEMTGDSREFALRLRLIDAKGRALEEQMVNWRKGPVAWSPDITARAHGAYRIVADVLGLDGETPVASAEACLDIVPADAPGLYFRRDHIAIVDGEPWFPIGVTSFMPTSAEAERIVGAGFSLLTTGGFTNGDADAVQANLDRADELGAWVIEWNNGHVYGKLTSEERHGRVAESAANVAGHPRFLGWMCDEAIWNGVPLSEVKDGYLAARAAAPTLVFWQNQAPRNTVADLARYCQWADVSGMDIYPVEGASHSDLPNKTLSVVGDEMEKQHLTVNGRKPIWAILQGFGWSAWEDDENLHKRAPTWAETRFMAYDAIVHGATGIVYWGASYEDQDAEIWESLRRIAGELSDLSPALVAEERVKISAGKASPVTAIGRRVGGKLWIIAVNESDQPIDAALRGARGVTGLDRFAEGDVPVRVRKGRVLDSFDPWEVHVYREP